MAKFYFLLKTREYGMSTLYYGEVFFGVKIFVKNETSRTLNELYSGKHPLTKDAVAKGLDVFARSLADRLQYNKDEVFVVVGRRLAMAGYDMEFFKEFDHRTLNRTIQSVSEELKTLNFQDEPTLLVVTSDSP